MEGCDFSNYLKNRQELSNLATIAEGFGPDPQLVPFVFSAIRQMSSMLETIPMERYEPQKLITEYMSCGLKNIYRVYLTTGGTLLCVEYFAVDREDANNIGKDVLQAVRAWSVPGQNAPLPVLAAHLRCNIRRGAAEFLYRELLTRALTWEGGAEMFGPLVGGL
jgi:hypothetical protein